MTAVTYDGIRLWIDGQTIHCDVCGGTIAPLTWDFDTVRDAIDTHFTEKNHAHQ